MKLCPDCGEDLLDVKRLRLEPGDILVLTRPADAPPMSPDSAENLRQWAAQALVKNEIWLMQDGITVTVLKEAEGEVLAKLPETADHVRVVPNIDSVFLIRGSSVEESETIEYRQYHWVTGVDEKQWWAVFLGRRELVSLCYSTRAVAERERDAQT